MTYDKQADRCHVSERPNPFILFTQYNSEADIFELTGIDRRLFSLMYGNIFIGSLGG